MATTRISGSTSNPIPREQTPNHSRREERSRTLVTHGGDDNKVRRALERLRRLLASGEPLRDDVPRGYYLNIVI